MRRRMSKNIPCCYIGCEEMANWVIYHGDYPGPDDYTHSCNEHIPDMLTDEKWHSLVWVEADD